MSTPPPHHPQYHIHNDQDEQADQDYLSESWPAQDTAAMVT